MAQAFEPKTLAPSSVGQVDFTHRRFEPIRITTSPRISGGTQNKKDDTGTGGSSGSLTIEDCQGNPLEPPVVLKWLDGKITTQGDITAYVKSCSDPDEPSS